MAVSSIFSVFLITWSVGHRPCRFHGSLLLIKINSIQLHRSWDLLLHNWIWVDNESRADFQPLWSEETVDGPPAAAANIWKIRTEEYSQMNLGSKRGDRTYLTLCFQLCETSECAPSALVCRSKCLHCLRKGAAVIALFSTFYVYWILRLRN